MRYSYNPHGTCSSQIDFDIEGNVVTNVKFHGGCPGNLAALSKVIDGKTVDEIYNLFKDIRCGNKPTSCSSELAKAVMQAYEDSKQK